MQYVEEADGAQRRQDGGFLHFAQWRISSLRSVEGLTSPMHPLLLFHHLYASLRSVEGFADAVEA